MTSPVVFSPKTPLATVNVGVSFLHEVQESINSSDSKGAIKNLLMALMDFQKGSDIDGLFEVLLILIPKFSNEDDFKLLMLRLPKILDASSQLPQLQAQLALVLADRYISRAQDVTNQNFIGDYLNAMDYYAVAIKIAEIQGDRKLCHEYHLLASQLFLRIVKIFGLNSEEFKIRLENVRGKIPVFGERIAALNACKRFCCVEEDKKWIKDLYEQAKLIFNQVRPDAEVHYLPHLSQLKLGGSPFTLLRRTRTEVYRDHLINFRSRFGFLNYQNTRNFQKDIMQATRDFFHIFLDDIFIVLGPPPCGYDIRAMGSIGREEPCPYSDLEFMIMIEKEECRSYFLNLTCLLEFQIVSLGETAGIRPIFTCISKINTSGFHLDAGGNPLREPGLLGIPNAIAQLQASDPSKINGRTLENTLLRSVSLSTNRPSLFEEHQKCLAAVLNDSNRRQIRSLTLIKERFQEFSDVWGSEPISLPNPVSIKDHYVQFINFFLADLALYCGIQDSNTLDIIDALAEKKVFTNNTVYLLKSAVSDIYRLRIRLHEFYSQQKEEAYLTSLPGCLLLKQEKDQLERIYWLVLRPLYQNVLPLVCGEGKLIGEVFQNLDLMQVAFDEFLKNKIDVKPTTKVLEVSRESDSLLTETAANTSPKIATKTAVVSKSPPEDPSDKFLSQQTKISGQAGGFINRFHSSSTTSSDLIPFYEQKIGRFSEGEIAQYIWLGPEAPISDWVQKVNAVAIYLGKQGFELRGIKADGYCFYSAFLKSLKNLSIKIPILDAQEDKIAYLKGLIATQYRAIKGEAGAARARQIEQDGKWLCAHGEGDLLAKALPIPIRIVTVSQNGGQCSIDDMLTFIEKDRESKTWVDLDESEKPKEYVLIVDLGGHFICAQPFSEEKTENDSGSSPKQDNNRNLSSQKFSNQAIAGLLTQARDYRTPELEKAFHIDSFHERYERIANQIIQIQAGNNNHLLEDLVRDFNFILNTRLESQVNPTEVKGYSELCDIYKKLNSFYEKELVSLNAQVELSEVEMLKRSQSLSSVNPSGSSLSSTSMTEVVSEKSPSYTKDSFLKSQPLMSPVAGIASLLLKSNAPIEEHQKYYIPLLSPDRETYGCWKLYLEAVKSNSNLVKQLLAICDNKKNTILHRTSKTGDVASLRFLLTLSVDLEQCNLQGNTALHEAVIGMGDETVRQLEIVQILVQHGANISALSNEKETVLLIAAERGYLNILKFLFSQTIDSHLIEQGDKDGKRPLHKAVWGDPKPAIVRVLIEKGADINGTNVYDYTPLHWAAKHGHFASAKLLLEHRADQTIVNKNGDLPIDLALKFGQDRIVRLLIDPTMESSPSQSFNDKDKDDDIEGSYYAHFEQAYESGEALEQLLFLEKLADNALTKKEYVKASHLLNSAYSAAALYKFDLPYKTLLLKKMERIEGLYLEELGRKTPAAHKNYLLRLRVNLDKARDIAKVRLQRGDPIVEIQAEMTASFKKFLSELIQHSIELLGRKPPTSFAVIGLGSMSRNEMCPCSDVEFAFLIQEATPATKEYFQRLSQFLHLRIINLGETAFPVIRPKRIGIVMMEGRSLTRSGFSMDIGGLSPLGKAGVYELIGTPKELSSFQESTWLEKNDAEIILVNSLTSCCLVSGNESLFKDYMTSTQKILDSRKSIIIGKKLREERALKLLRGHLDEFRPLLDDNRIYLRGFDLKKDLYRPFQMVIGALALYHGVDEESTLATLEKLQKKGVLSVTGKVQIQKVLSKALSWRFKAHLFYKSEKEIVYFAKGENDTSAQGLLVIDVAAADELLEIYRTLIPFSKAAREFVNGNMKSFSINLMYDKSLGDIDFTNEMNRNYLEAQQGYSQVVALNPNSSKALQALGHIKNILGESNQALSFHLDRYSVLKRKHVDSAHPEIAGCLMDIGAAYMGLGEYNKGIGYLNKALEIFTLIYVKSTPHENIAGCLQNLGAAYDEIKDFEKAVDHLNRALKMFQQIFENKPHPEIAGCLMNLGSTHCRASKVGEGIGYYEQALKMLKQICQDKSYPEFAHRMIYNLAMCEMNLGVANKMAGDFEKAVDHLNRALAMSQDVYKDKPHPIIAKCLMNLGGSYNDISNFNEGIGYYEQALKMLKQIYGNTSHPDIASVLANLGCAYINVNNFEKAVGCFEQELRMLELLIEGVPPLEIAKCLQNLGGACIRSNQLDRGIGYLNQALAMQEQLNKDKPDLNIAKCLIALGMANKMAGAFKTAIEYLNQALAMQKLFFGTESHPLIAQSFNMLGVFYSEMEDFENAITYHEKALAILTEFYEDQPHIDVFVSLDGLGRAYGKIKNYAQAMSYYMRALAMNKALPRD